VSQAQARSRSNARRFTLNSDGQRHPRVNAALAYTVLAGIASFVLGMLNRGHMASMAGAILGITGFLIGMWAQMESATREERIFIVFGIVASFVGLGLGIAHGGFS